MEWGREGVIFRQLLRPMMSVKGQHLALSADTKAAALCLCLTSQSLVS